MPARLWPSSGPDCISRWGTVSRLLWDRRFSVHSNVGRQTMEVWGEVYIIHVHIHTVMDSVYICVVCCAYDCCCCVVHVHIQCTCSTLSLVGGLFWCCCYCSCSTHWPVHVCAQRHKDQSVPASKASAQVYILTLTILPCIYTGTEPCSCHYLHINSRTCETRCRHQIKVYMATRYCSYTSDSHTSDCDELSFIKL